MDWQGLYCNVDCQRLLKCRHQGLYWNVDWQGVDCDVDWTVMYVYMYISSCLRATTASPRCPPGSKSSRRCTTNSWSSPASFWPLLAASSPLTSRRWTLWPGACVTLFSGGLSFLSVVSSLEFWFRRPVLLRSYIFPSTCRMPSCNYVFL